VISHGWLGQQQLVNVLWANIRFGQLQALDMNIDPKGKNNESSYHHKIEGDVEHEAVEQN
jgi:hypothetical protein